MTNFSAVNYRILYIALFAFLVNEGQAQAPVSNLQLLEKSCRSVIDSVNQPLAGDTASFALNTDMVGGEKAAFLKGLFIRYVKSQGYEISDEGRFKYTFERFEVRFEYDEDVKRLAGFSNTLSRRLVFDLDGRITDSVDGRVTDSFAIKKTLTDRVKSDVLGQIEQSPFFFTRGHLKSKSRWTRLIEPAIVISSVTTLIYLFFSMRT